MKVKTVVGVAVVVVLVGVAGVFYWIDHIAKVAVEQGATFALGVNTSLDSMNVGILSGSVGMAGLNVANPAGYGSPHFLKLGEGSVAVSLGSLRSDRVQVPELTLNGIRMSLEKRGGKANYQAILDNLKKFESGEEKPAAEKPDGKGFVFERIAIRDVQVDVELLPVGGSLTRLPVTIDRIDLRNIGSDSNKGVILAELSSVILKAILQSVLQKAGDILPADLTTDLTQGLAQLTDLGKTAQMVVGDVKAQVDEATRKLGEAGAKAAEDIARTGDELRKGAEDAGKKVTEGLGGLLGGDKDKKNK